MIESQSTKVSVKIPNYLLKREEENSKEEKKQVKSKGSGTNFNEYGYKLFSRVQLFFFYLSLVLIPIVLFPLEWMMFEYSKVFVLLFFTIIILTFELIKFFIIGKLEIFKSPRDIILLILAVSFFISLIFSSDFLVSFWGYELRLGTGFLSIVAILFYVLTLKSVVKEFKDAFYLIFYLTLGILISAVLSILSFYGINPFGFIAEFDKFFFTGLPLFSSAKLSIVIWSLGIIFSSFVFNYFYDLFSNDESYLNRKLSVEKAYRKKKIVQIILSLLFILILMVFVFSISIFSIKSAIWVGLISSVAVAAILFIVNFLTQNKPVRIVTLISIVLILGAFGIFRLPLVQDTFSIDKDDLVEQVTLDSPAIWGIAVSSLSESFSRGIVGLGNDNFVVAYNLYRPAFSENVDLNAVNYSYANNEVYNIVSNRGLLGIVVWLLVGFFVIKQFINYLTDEKLKKILKPASLENIAIILLDVTIIFIWFSAFLVYYSFILYFILFLILVISSLYRNIAFKMYSESFVIHTNFFVERIGQTKNYSLPKFLIVIVCIASIFCLYLTLNDFTSRVNAVKAESILYDINDPDKSFNLEETGEMFQKAIESYDEAIAKNSQNYVFRRKVSLVLMDYISKILGPEFMDISDDLQRQTFVGVVGVYAEAATEEAKKATDLAPMIALNWSTRDLVYAELVKMGFGAYANTGLQVSEQSILRNPNNYNSYVNKATYLYISGDTAGAISAIRQSLDINPYNITGLVLAGEISMKMQDYTNAKTYFQTAEALLQELDFTRDGVVSMYEKVKENLDYLWSVEPETQIPTSEKAEPEVEEEESLFPDEEISD